MVHFIVGCNKKVVPVDCIDFLHLMDDTFKPFRVGNKEICGGIAHICVIFQQLLHGGFTDKGIVRILVVRRFVVMVALVCFISHDFK